MSRLNSRINDLLSDDVLEKLSKRKINTTRTFIETNPELIAKLTGLHFRHVLQIKDNILMRFASKICNGANYYEEFLLQGALIPSGVTKLDELLDGGFLTGNLYELCGGSSTGKSQISLSLAANVSCNFQQKSLYFDTKGDFSANRLCSFLAKKTDNVGESLQLIKVCQPQNAYQLFECLSVYSKKLDNNGETPVRLLIIDSLAALFYQFIGEHKESASLLSNIASVLHYMAFEYNMAIIVTNLSTHWQKGEAEETQKAALGKFWAHVPHTRLTMTRLSSGLVLVTVSKSSGLVLGVSVTLDIKEDCIE